MSGARNARRHDERVYSFVDATSFATMCRLRITRVLAFNGDFSEANITEVRPEPLGRVVLTKR